MSIFVDHHESNAEISREVRYYDSSHQQHSQIQDALHCKTGDLLGPVGLLVQGLLAIIAFTSLIVKRFFEPRKQRRSWKVWFFDTSKQAVGAGIIHFANVFLADIFKGDPCTWYFVSFLLDSTLGLVVIYSGLKISQSLAERNQWHSLLLGEYGDPPQCNAWIGQCGVYVIVMIVEKVLMTLLVLFHFWTTVREIILSPITNPTVEIILVMFIVPFIINALIFWVVDNFLKKNAFKPRRQNSVYSTSLDSNSVHYQSSSAQCYLSTVSQSDDCDLLDRSGSGHDPDTDSSGSDHQALLGPRNKLTVNS